MPPSVEAREARHRERAAAVGLTWEEYGRIARLLGRDPGDLELGLFGAMWSEHCSYKSSRAHLGRLPSRAPQVLLGPGENAGVLDIGDGWALALRVESHNHPSAIEPFEGAATGVGGILRDIFAVGARPVALLDGLYFGELEDARSRYLFGGVVAGIAHYGNCLHGRELIHVRVGGVEEDIAIGAFVERYLANAAGDTLDVYPLQPVEVWSPGWCRVRRLMRRRAGEWIRLELGRGRSLTVTPDHPVTVVEDGRLVEKPGAETRPGDRLPVALDERAAAAPEGEFRLGVARVTAVRREPCDEPAYDIEVPQTHRFVTTGGIVTHNCTGVPTVSGQTVFDPAYADNPLVNVMCAGLLRKEELVRGIAPGPGGPVLLVGNKTGRDGIHGASLLASRSFGGEDGSLRPAVQVGDPFVGKLLIEACLELAGRGMLAGLNDLGAAGIVSAASETATRAGTGIEIDVSRVPVRETAMTPYEVMLSESQERMLLVPRPGREREVAEVCRRFGLEAAEIGRVTDDGVLRVFDAGRAVAEVPAEALTSGSPRYRRPISARAAGPRFLPPDPDPSPQEAAVWLARLLAGKRWIYRQYDHMVQTNTVLPPGAGDAAVLRQKGRGQGIALALEGTGRQGALDPWCGGALAVAAAARAVACAGAQPLGLTDCLNFGSPEDAEVMWAFSRAVDGVAAACRALSIPVVGGNVSFYNETRDAAGSRPIRPTPVVGMAGLMPDASRARGAGFARPGDLAVLLGRSPGRLDGSLYQLRRWGRPSGRPARPQWSLERALLGALARLPFRSAHAVGAGGLAAALAECCLIGGLGGSFELPPPRRARLDERLFGEAPGGAVVSIDPGDAGLLAALDLPHRVLGRVEAGPEVRIGPLAPLDLRRDFEEAIPRWF